MASMEFDLDSNGGLMNQILALTAPPGSRDRSDSANGASSTAEPVSSLSAHPYFKRPGRGHNRDCCDACGEGGDLICCDICPASFHLICHDPPIYEEDIPLGEWGCFQCQVASMEEGRGSGASRNGIANFKLNRGIKRKERDDASSKSLGKGEVCHKNSKRDKCDSVTSSVESSGTTNPNGGASSRVLVNGHEMVVSDSPLRVLVRQVAISNPKQFVLPYKHTVPIAFPGESKSIFRHNGRRGAPFKKKSAHDNGIALPAKLCFTCNKGFRAGALLCCDYCPLMFHLDCLDPPLTIAPTHRWMCPNHPEHFMDEHLLTSCRVSERVKLWDKCRGLVDQVAVQRSFFNLVHRKRPPSRYKIKRALRKAIRVPEAIKEAYRNPVPLLPALPPAHLRPPPLPSPLPFQYVASHLYERLKPDSSFSATDFKGRESSRESSPSDVRQSSPAPCSVATSSAPAKEDSSKDASNSISVSNSTNTECQSKQDGISSSEVRNEVISPSCSSASVEGCTKVCSDVEAQCRDSAALMHKVPASEAVPCDRINKDAEADTTLDSSSQLSEDMESQKEISTEEEGEDSHDSEFHVGRNSNALRATVPEVSGEDSDADNYASSQRGKLLKSSARADLKSIEPCLLKQCDDKVIGENKFKRIKIVEGIQGFIQSNGDINDKWNSLIDEQFENNNKIVPKRKGDCKIDDSSNKILSKPTENNETNVDAFTKSQSLPLETRLKGGQEMEVVTVAPVSSVLPSFESEKNTISSCRSSPTPIKSNYITTTGSLDFYVTERSVNVCRGCTEVKFSASKSTPATTMSSCEPRVTSVRSEVNAMLDGLRSSSHLAGPPEKRSSDAVTRHVSLSSAALASPNPDWPSPIMDISDDSSTSERPLLVDCLDESNKQSHEGECNSSYPSKILPNNKNCFGPNKSYYNNHVVTSQLTNTFNSYSKSYQVFNSYPSKLSSSCSSRDLTVEQNNFVNFRVCPAQTTTVVANSLPVQAPNCQGLQASEDVRVAAPLGNFLKGAAQQLRADAEGPLSVDGHTGPETPAFPCAKPTKEEIDVWLTGLVSFQSSVAKMMLLKGPSSGTTTPSYAATTPRTTASTTSSSLCCCSSNLSTNCSEAPLKVTCTAALSSSTAAPSVPTRVLSCPAPSVSPSAQSPAAATGPPPCLPKPSSVSTIAHPTTLPSTPRAGRKQVLIPRTSPTGSSSSSPPFFLPSSTGTAQLNKTSFPASGSAARTPAKTYIARVSSSVGSSNNSSSSNHSPESRALCLSDLLHETLQALQTKLHAAHAVKHSELSSLDHNLVELLAMQRLEQLQQTPTAPPSPPLYTAPALPAHALLCPLVEPPSVQPVWVDLQVPPPDAAPPVPMQYRLLTVGKGSHNNVNLESYGHCNYVSSNHACIILDEVYLVQKLTWYQRSGFTPDDCLVKPHFDCYLKYSGQYELVNYSSDGSMVDGGVYRCDLSGQKSVTSQPTSSSLQQQVRDCIQKYREAYNKNGAPGYRFCLPEDEDSKPHSSGPSVGARSLRREAQSVMTSRSDQVIRRCGCSRTSVEDRIQGGWEGPAVLRHGSFIKFGCLKFVFSIVETASTGNWRAVTEEAYAKFYEREGRERREEEEAAAAAVKSKEKETSRGSGKHGKEKNKEKDKDVIFDGGKESTHKETLEKERKKESKKNKRDKESKKDRENKSRS